MQLRGHAEQVLDLEGTEHADLDALKKKMLMEVRGLAKADVEEGLLDLRFRIDAEDLNGVIVHTLGFSEALKIILPDGSEIMPKRRALEASPAAQ